MDDDVACIHQDPIACRHTLHARGAEATILQIAQQPVGDGIDVAMGPAACDHQVIGNGGLTGNVDVSDVFSLSVIKAGKDGAEEILRLAPFRTIGTGRSGFGCAFGKRLGLCVQGSNLFSCTLRPPTNL